MWRKVPARIKSFKIFILKLFQDLKNLYHIFKTQRESLVCPIVHFILSVGCNAGAVPFRIHKLDNGFRFLTVTGGIRKWATKCILLIGAVRGILLIGFSTKMKWTVDGLFTADFLGWLPIAGYASFWVIVSLKMLFYSKDCQLIYNGLGEILRSFGSKRKYMEGKNILMIKGQHQRWLLYGSAITCNIMLGIPITSAACCAGCINSPLLLPSYIVGSYAAIRGELVITLLFWACVIVDWIILNYVMCMVTWTALIVVEGLCSVAILLREVRTSPNVHWTVKIKHHAQLELICKVFNDFVAWTLAVAILIALLLAVSSSTVLIKMDVERGFPRIGLVPAVAALAFGCPWVGFLLMKFAEDLRAESIAMQRDLVAEIIAYFKLRNNTRASNITSRPTGRFFRRRPIGLTLGGFMYIDAGQCVTFMMQIVENTVSFVFMVDLWSVPISIF